MVQLLGLSFKIWINISTFCFKISSQLIGEIRCIKIFLSFLQITYVLKLDFTLKEVQII